jgi:hypothetical protein
VRRQKYFGSEQAFESIWQNADYEGIWLGDAASLAAEFGASVDVAEEVLAELCDRLLIEKVYTGAYIIVKWREKDAPADAEPY